MSHDTRLPGVPPKQRQVRVEQKSALAAMQRLESRSDEELMMETRYRSAAHSAKRAYLGTECPGHRST